MDGPVKLDEPPNGRYAQSRDKSRVPSPSPSLLSPKYSSTVDSFGELANNVGVSAAADFFLPSMGRTLRGLLWRSCRGQRFHEACISLRSLRRPCAGRTLPVPHFWVPAANSAPRVRERGGGGNRGQFFGSV